MIDQLVGPAPPAPFLTLPLPILERAAEGVLQRGVGVTPNLASCSRRLDFSAAIRIVFSNKEFLTIITTEGWGQAMGIYLCGVRPASHRKTGGAASLGKAVLESLCGRVQPGRWSLPQGAAFSLTDPVARPPLLLPKPGEVVEIVDTPSPWQTMGVRGSWVRLRNKWGEERRVNGRPGLLVSSTSVLLTWIPAQVRERGNRASATAEGRSR